LLLSCGSADLCLGASAQPATHPLEKSMEPQRKKVRTGALKPEAGWRITVRFVNPTALSVTEHELTCAATTTVRQLAERFAALVGTRVPEHLLALPNELHCELMTSPQVEVPASAVRLLFGGKQLNDMDATLDSSGVENNAVVNALVMMRGANSVGALAADQGTTSARPARKAVKNWMKDGARNLFVGRKVLRVTVGGKSNSPRISPTATAISLETPNRDDEADEFFRDDVISESPGPCNNGADLDKGGGFRLLRLDGDDVVKTLDDIVVKDLVGLTIKAIEWREFKDGRPVPAGTSATPPEHRDAVKTSGVLVFPGFELWSVKDSSKDSAPADMTYMICGGDEGGAIEADLPADSWD